MVINNIERYRQSNGFIGFRRERGNGSIVHSRERVLEPGIVTPIQRDLQLPSGLKPSKGMESFVKKAVDQGGVPANFIQGLAYSLGTRAATEGVGRTKFGNFGKAGKEFTERVKQKATRFF